MLLPRFSQALQIMSNIYDLDEYRKKREGQLLRDDALELLALLDSLMINDEPVIISVVDSDGNESLVNLDDIMSLSDSNPYD